MNKSTRPVESATASGAFHIEDIYPCLNDGRFPIKRIVGEPIDVWADIFRDGHDVIAAALIWRREQDHEWQRTAMFIAMHGSWNRTTKQGYSVMRATVDSSGKVTLQPFLEGFLQDAKADPPMWGRPVDVLVMKDGALLVSDDYNGIVYRVSYAR